MTDGREDVGSWRERILRDELEATRALEALDITDHRRVVALARQLVPDPSTVVRRSILGFLGRQGETNDAATEAAVLPVLSDADRRDDHVQRTSALFALGRVGTAAVFPTLLAFARRGYYQALEAAARQARTPQQRQEVLELARVHLLARAGDPPLQGAPREDPRRFFARAANLRLAALHALQLHSTVAREEPLLVRALPFTDEFVLSALRDHGTPVALPALRRLLDKYAPRDADAPPGAEYEMALRAIQGIEERAARADPT